MVFINSNNLGKPIVLTRKKLYINLIIILKLMFLKKEKNWRNLPGLKQTH